MRIAFQHLFYTRPRLFSSTFRPFQARRKDYYEILGLESQRTCSAKEIKSKFYELSMRFHPDKNPDDESAHEKFLHISEAYSVLGNELKRREYDREQQASSSFTHPSGYGTTGRRSNMQEWSSRAYREKLNPNDYILYRRGEVKNGRGSSSRFNFKAHQEGHYGMGGMADSTSRKRFYERMYYRQLYEERSWKNSVFPFIFLLGSSITLLFSDFFKLLWI